MLITLAHLRSDGVQWRELAKTLPPPHCPRPRVTSVPKTMRWKLLETFFHPEQVLVENKTRSVVGGFERLLGFFEWCKSLHSPPTGERMELLCVEVFMNELGWMFSASDDSWMRASDEFPAISVQQLPDIRTFLRTDSYLNCRFSFFRNKSTNHDLRQSI